MRAGSCWALTTTEGLVIRASRPLAGLLHLSPRQLRAGNLFSILGGEPGDRCSSEVTRSGFKTVVAQGFSPASGSPKGLRYSFETGSTQSWWPARTVVVSVCGQSVAMQLAIVEHRENRLWLLSPATKMRPQNPSR
jgi:hypothetical protein